LREHWPAAEIARLLASGVPAKWPDVYRYEPNRDNRLNPAKAGDVRDGTDELAARVRAAALMGLDPLGTEPTFPEAGPRQRLAFPLQEDQHELKVAILVAGAIAPGINAVIDAIVQRHHAYLKADGDLYDLRVYGVKDGFLAIGDGDPDLAGHLVELKPDSTVEYATRGGSMLGTSRGDRLLPEDDRFSRLSEIADALSTTDILYVICGDGGMKAAHALWHLANRSRPPDRRLSVVTVPKTMDNDILWVWQSFGFLSAVDESRKIVETLHTEVRSNPRLGIVQLFGSDSGFVVSHAVLASATGHATLALIPEIKFSAVGVARYLKRARWLSTKLDGPTAPIDK
jgi:6-phosphofructokinase 1